MAIDRDLIPDAYMAVIFDFDGVIVESVDLKAEAFARLYEPFGADVVARVVAHHRHHGGLARFAKIKLYHETFIGVPAPPALVDQWARRLGTMVEDGVAASPLVRGARDLLAEQAARRPLFVASGTPEDELQRIVGRMGLSDFFQAVRGSPTLKTDLVAEILGRYRLEPARVVMIGDSITDHEAAVGNDIAFIGRVAPTDGNPFPPEIPVVADLADLVRRRS